MLRWGQAFLLLLAVWPSDCTLGRLFRPRPIVVVNGAILTGHPARHTLKYIHRNPRFMHRIRHRGPGFAAGVSIGGGIFRKTIRMLTPAFNLAHTRISLVFQAPTIRRLDGFLNEVVEDIHSTQNNELENDLDLAETFNTAFNESDGQLAPPPRHRYRPPHRRPGNQGPHGPGRPGYGRPNGPDNGRPHGSDYGRPDGTGNGRPHGSGYGRPGGTAHGRPHGSDRDGRDYDHSTPWDDPYGMNITIASPIVANEIKLLNASIYVAVVRLVIPLSQGGLNANATAAGHARIRAAAGNFSAAITSLNNLRKTVNRNNKHARALDEASDRLIDDMSYMNKLLREDGNQDEIAELIAKMIYDSVPVLNSLVLADVPPDRISAFFLNVIEGIVSVVVGETMLMASNRSNSMNDVVQFINAALKPLTISASYSTMSEPDFGGNQGNRRPGPVFEPLPGERDRPRNTFDRDSQGLPPGNGDIRNDFARNDGRNNPPMNNQREQPFDDRDRPRAGDNYPPINNQREQPFDGRDRPRAGENYPPMNNQREQPFDGRQGPRPGENYPPMNNQREQPFDGRQGPPVGENYPPMNNQREQPFDNRGMPRAGENIPPFNNQMEQPFNDRERPMQYSNDDPGRSRYRNPRGEDPRERDYPRDTPRGMNRRNWDDPRARDEGRREPWEDERYPDDPRRERWDDPPYEDDSRQDPWSGPRGADSPREDPWGDSSAVDDTGRDPRDGPWDSPGGPDSARPSALNNRRDRNNARRSSRGNAAPGPRDDTRKAFIK